MIVKSFNYFSGGQFDKVCVKECHGCGSNMTCFIEKQYEKIREAAKRPEIREYDMSTGHLYPQSWFVILILLFLFKLTVNFNINLYNI